MIMTNNPYTDFVRSLSDAQLDALYELAIVDDDLEVAVHHEYETRERRTHLTFYTPNIAVMKHLLTTEQPYRGAFIVAAKLAFVDKRLFNGWSDEIETAAKTLFLELLEQL